MRWNHAPLSRRPVRPGEENHRGHPAIVWSAPLLGRTIQSDHFDELPSGDNAIAHVERTSDRAPAELDALGFGSAADAQERNDDEYPNGVPHNTGDRSADRFGRLPTGSSGLQRGAYECELVTGYSIA